MGTMSGDGLLRRNHSSFEKIRGDAQLIKYVPLPSMENGNCITPAPSTGIAASGPQLRTFNPIPRGPLRVIKDPNPAFSTVGIARKWSEVVAADENNFQIVVYDRSEDTSPDAIAIPKRTISGPLTEIEFQCGLYIDQSTGDIYGVNNDIKDSLVIFSHGAQGNVPPDRWLRTPHGSFGIAVDENHDELFLTVQHDSAVVVYDKKASKLETPIRLLQGKQTHLADPHGIALDPVQDLMFVTNYGSTHDVKPPRDTSRLRKNWPLQRHFAIPGSGSFHSPSITVYNRTSRGNSAPIRMIQGQKTRLNWPTGLTVYSERNELFVANDMDHSILVFNSDANGDVAPARILKGPKTGITNPTGVYVDTLHKELWVANFGDHSLTVYPIDAKGDVTPLRTIRGAPAGAPSLMIGNPGAIAYDTKRKEILVPN
jgi:DNA-binding beta-propeller fold protein YncE